MDADPAIADAVVDHGELGVVFLDHDRRVLRARGAAGTPTVLVRGQARLGFDPGQVAETLAAAR